MYQEFREARNIYFGTCTVIALVWLFLGYFFKTFNWTAIFLLVILILILVFMIILVKYDKTPNLIKLFDCKSSSYVFYSYFIIIGIFVCLEYYFPWNFVFSQKTDVTKSYLTINWNSIFHITIYFPIILFVYLRAYCYKMKYKNLFVLKGE